VPTILAIVPAIGCRAPDMTKTVTDGNGTTHFFDVFDGKSVLGKAMAFLPAGIACRKRRWRSIITVTTRRTRSRATSRR
jgi:hypothetical protein